MDQARSTISKIFNGEPHSYTRFNLTQNMEGDNSQVEMKLSSDVDEENGVNGVGDHVHHNSNGKPYIKEHFRHTPKSLFLMAAVALLILVIGILIGYLSPQKKVVIPTCSASVGNIGEPVAHETGAAPIMDWDDVKSLLSKKLIAVNLDSLFSELSSVSHQAGSADDEVLGQKVIQRFKKFDMKPWTDEHFIKVQEPSPSSANKITYQDGSNDSPSGFLSYSKSGSVSGSVLYAHYGRVEDFTVLQDKNINMTDRVLLLRAGKNSFAEKVANAAKMKAAAVLIYPHSGDVGFGPDTDLYGHVHMGSGDPYTPGFPSFNHTQFPPVKSSGLPDIMAQTITQNMAKKILRVLKGQSCPTEWQCYNMLGEESNIVTVEVNNVLTEKKIVNVFGVIKGFVDPDRYVVVGAQRDAWGTGFAASTVGTSVLVELARSISDMVKNDGFKPRRSIVFVSWTAGAYGNVGATEWLEGYLSSLSMKAFSYINLDGVVTGQSRFRVAASPLMHTLVENALREVKKKDKSLFDQFAKSDWENSILETMQMENAAYPFVAFSGIPSVSFGFSSDKQFFNTKLDTKESLSVATSNQISQLAETAGQFAGHMVLRLVHDHLLPMDLMKYNKVIRSHVALINARVKEVQRMQPQLLPKSLTTQWLISASGSYSRAARSLAADIRNSDLEDIEMCRILNDRMMMVERNFLSPYVSPRETPFRHILLGSGLHTLEALSKHLDALKMDSSEADANLFRNQFALATWTVQGCANSVAGDIWALDNEI